MTVDAKVDRSDKLVTALRLEAVTVAWMIVEGAVSIAAGVASDSLLLVAFGVDSVIELISAGLLWWRLSREARAIPDDAATLEAIERKTAKIGGYLLYTLALYVFSQSIYGLFHRHSAENAWWGVAVTAIAAFAMPVVAKAKLRLAEAIDSRALRADAIETLTCGYLAIATLAGLLANAFFHWWWLDGVACLCLVPFLVKEGREAIKGGCCSHDC